MPLASTPLVARKLAEMITEREQLGKQLQTILDEKTNPWGITVHSVEIRDVHIPQELEDAMSRQAQAERERQARIILGTAETEIASRFVAAGAEYENRPLALHLRAMNMLYEAIKEKGSMVIVPSSAVETMGLGGLAGVRAKLAAMLALDTAAFGPKSHSICSASSALFARAVDRGRQRRVRSPDCRRRPGHRRQVRPRRSRGWRRCRSR